MGKGKKKRFRPISAHETGNQSASPNEAETQAVEKCKEEMDAKPKQNIEQNIAEKQPESPCKIQNLSISEKETQSNTNKNVSTPKPSETLPTKSKDERSPKLSETLSTKSKDERSPQPKKQSATHTNEVISSPSESKPNIDKDEVTDKHSPINPQPSTHKKNHPNNTKPETQPTLSKNEATSKPSSNKLVVQGAGGSIGNIKRQFQPPQTTDKNKMVGKIGRKIMLQANHFEMNVRIPDRHIYHYDLQFQFPYKHEVRKSDRPLLIKVIEAFKQKYASVLGDQYSITHDGFKNIYTCRMLGYSTPTFEGNVLVKEDETSKQIDMKVKIKYVSSISAQDAIEEYFKRGTTATKPNDAVQALNIVLGMTPQLHYVTLGRNYFNPTKGTNGLIDLGGGKSMWVGTFQSVRLGWKPMLNIDMANKPAYEQAPIIEFIKKILTPPNRGPNQQQGGQPLTEIRDKRDFKKVEDELKQLKIRFTRPDGEKRDYRINKLMDPASQLKLKLDTGELITVEKYFVKQYKYQLKFPKLPCLHVGDPKRTIYLPMELCELKKQVAPRSKILSEEEAAVMIRKTAIPPNERKRRICDNLQDLNKVFRNDQYAKAFGISVSDKMTEIQGRVLPPPSLKYKKQTGDDCEFKLGRDGGKWNMGSERDREKYRFLSGMHLKNWGVIDLAGLRDNEQQQFLNAIHSESTSRGMKVEYPICCKADERNVTDVESKFKQLYDQLKTKGVPNLIMIFVSRKTNVRARIKFLGDSVYNVPTQFILKKNILGRNGPSPQTLHNICLKLNSKLRGVNQAFYAAPAIMRVPVIIMGADVTHPSPGDKKPSIAAVVGSCDPQASLYNCEVRLQYEGQVVEIIKQMEEVTKSLLMKFYQQTRQKPQKIVFYRDGVSEGQFLEVLNCELSAIRRACSSLHEAYKPAITFLVAQKRHKTRLFTMDERDGFGKMRNVPPGTIVDTLITHPTEYDFFLASHEGIQGTTKPTHYHLLWDDSNMPPDELQKLTYHLCHLYSRCERSVSYPAPTYYAHLAAFRAREHHNALIEKYGKDIPKESLDKIEHINLTNYFI